MKKVLIVGGGIAGTSVALALIKRNYDVTLFDNSLRNSATLVAAGMMNPLVFKRMLFCWRGYEAFDYSTSYYQKQEEEWGIHFLQATQMAKLMHSDHEKKLWKDNMFKESYNEFLSQQIIPSYLSEQIQSFDAGIVNPIYQLKTETYLRKAHEKINESGKVIPSIFDHDQIQLEDNTIQYKGEQYDEVVFAEGRGIEQNPFFNYLPFKFTKGELILIKASLKLDAVLKKNVFIVPEAKNTFWVGATYDWKNLNDETTEDGKLQLIEKVASILKIPFEVIEQKAGIRPTVADRRPYIGTHPNHPRLHVFNGMGTRGVMYAPLLSEEFIDYLEGKSKLAEEINIQRIPFNSPQQS